MMAIIMIININELIIRAINPYFTIYSLVKMSDETSGAK